MRSEQASFADRADAGRELALRLEHLKGEPVIVLALPRGGVPVGYQVARALEAPLDVFVVRKLGTPGHIELAMGALASGGVRVLNDEVVEWYGIPPAVIDAVAAREQRELERRERLYRNGRDAASVAGLTVILVDDGLATGSTMLAALKAVRQRQPKAVIVAVPVGAAETCARVAEFADETICARMPEPFSAVGQWYRDFAQTTDEEVRELLRAGTSVATPPPG